MSVRAEYINGVFKPLERVTDAVPGKTYRVFSEDELRDLNETSAWLKAAERSFQFWDNDQDAAYDSL